MKQTPTTIPAAFVKLDASVTTADRYLDVRTQQILRANHNALLSGSHGRTILTSHISYYATGDTSRLLTQTGEAGLGDISNAMCILSTRVRLSQHIKQCAFRMRCQTTRAIQVNVYPVLSKPNSQRDLENVTAVTTSSTSLTVLSSTITVPPMLQSRRGYVECDFSVYADSDTYGATIFGAPAPITSVANDRNGNPYWITDSGAGYGGAQAGDIVYFPSDATITPRRLTNATTTTLIAPLIDPWILEEPYPTTADTVQCRQGSSLKVVWVELLELPRSGTFDTLLEKI